MVTNDRRRLTISLDPVDYSVLEVLADTHDRSLNWLICQAVKRYIEDSSAAPTAVAPRERQTRLL